MSTGGVGSQNLDTRLLRFRSRGGGEEVSALVEDLLAAGRTSDAQEVIGKALRARPEDGPLQLLDGRARLAAGDLLGAQAALLKAARSLPKEKGPFRWLGEVLLKRGDPGRAAKVLERALSLDPSDRAVQLLLDRAKRLERVADDAGAEPPPPSPKPAAPPRPPPRPKAAARPQPPPPEPDSPEERTVIRRDLTDHLRQLSREEEEERAAEAAATDLPLTQPGNESALDDFSMDFEDEPTNMFGQELVQEAIAPTHRQAKTAPARPAVARTMGFGSPAREAPEAPPEESTRREASPFASEAEPAPPQRSPHLSTSPGAASAPEPPPPKRALPSQRRAEVPTESKPPGRPSPWDESSAERPLPADDLVPAPPLPSRGLEARPAPRAPEPASPPTPAFAPAPEPAPPGPDPFAAADDSADPFAAAEAAAPPERAPDVVVDRRGQEDVDGILRMLKDQGLFEPPSGDAAGWAERKEVAKTQASGTRIGLWMGVVWLLAVGLVVGGYFGWQAWLDHRHTQAASLIEQASQEAYAGDHADLVAAERHLREARDLHPQEVSIPTLLLFVHAQRALEDGAFSAGYLRPAIQRAESMEGEDLEPYLDAARAVLSAAEGGPEEAATLIGEALEARPRDAAILYLAGRLEQRLGGEDALTHLQAASEAEQTLNAPRIALAEARYDEGDPEGALELLEQVLSNDAEHLRARLWRAFMTSDDGEPAAKLAELEQIAEHLEDHGAPTDHVLYQLTRARLLRRDSDTEGAGDAVDQALRAGATEPRLLALVAVEARRAGKMRHAEHAARTAVQGAPTNEEFRKLLAGIQLTRRDGAAALSTLQELSADDPDVLEMRAEAALLLGTQEALTAAAEGLDAYIEAEEQPSVGARALRIRTHVRLGQAQEMLPVARQLAEDAPGDPAASLALGETALRLRDADAAVESLETVVSASPEDADGHYLLGRARRMAGDGEGARASLERAVELTPEHYDAKLSLGGLLLDLGDFEAAEALYRPLSRLSRTAVGIRIPIQGRLGLVEALIGLGRLDDAQVQLEGLGDEVAETPTARVTEARLRLAQGQAGEALQAIRPVATGEGATATVLALYGDALLAARQAEPAQEAYSAGVEADSGSPEALLGQAEMAVRSQRESDAIELLDRVRGSLERRIRPPSMHARMHTLYGRAYLLGDRDDAARRELEAAIETEAEPADAHFFLGEALSGTDSATARTHYERYLELDAEGRYSARARRAIR